MQNEVKRKDVMCMELLKMIKKGLRYKFGNDVLSPATGATHGRKYPEGIRDVGGLNSLDGY